jgi:hypothetical protein
LTDLHEFHSVLFDEKTMLESAMCVQNGRREEVGLNLFEWLFIRRMAVAWQFSVGV